MLTNELTDSWTDAAKEHNHAVTHQMYRVPTTLSQEQTAFLMRLYSRDEFDKLCSGPDRHLKFAKWATKNYSTWLRIIEREQMEMLTRIEASAATFGVGIIPTPESMRKAA